MPTGGLRMAWDLRLVGTGVDGQSRRFDVTEISRSEGLGDIANLGERARERGLTLAEGKRCWRAFNRSSLPRKPTIRRRYDRIADPAAGGAM